MTDLGSMTAPARFVAATVPYAWPWDGDLGADRLALVVAGVGLRAGSAGRADARRGRSPASTRSPPPSAVPAGSSSTSPTTAADPGHPLPAADRDGPGDAGARGASSMPPSTSPSSPAASTASSARRSTSASATSGVDHLLLAGFGLEGPVHSTSRSANDGGYECLAPHRRLRPPRSHTAATAAISSVTMSGGIFGAVGTTTALLRRPRGRTRRTGVTMTDTAVPAADPDDHRRGGLDPTRIRRRRALHLALRRRDRSGPHRAGQHRLADRLLRPGRLRRPMGYDLNLTRAGLEPTAKVLAAARAAGVLVDPHPRGPPARPGRLPAEQAVALQADRRRHRRRRPVRPHPRAGRAGLGHRARGRTRSTAS